MDQDNSANVASEITSLGGKSWTASRACKSECFELMARSNTYEAPACQEAIKMLRKTKSSVIDARSGASVRCDRLNFEVGFAGMRVLHQTPIEGHSPGLMKR